MKLFEIGDGLKSIKVPSHYYSDWEEENAILYDPECDYIEIRISVLTVEPKNPEDVAPMFEDIVEREKEAGRQASVIGDKSYFTYTKDSESDGIPIRLFFYEIGYRCHCILISVTVPSDRLEEPAVGKVLGDVEAMIPTIEAVPTEGPTIFEPKYTDLAEIDRRISAVLGIREEEIERTHKSGRTPKSIQRILDSGKLGADNTFELQSLGLAFGDYIRYTDDAFHWAVVSDEYGRDLCLQYKALAMTVFPLTMISKRVEDGEKFDVAALSVALVDKISAVATQNDYAELDHNF